MEIDAKEEAKMEKLEKRLLRRIKKKSPKNRKSEPIDVAFILYEF